MSHIHINTRIFKYILCPLALKNKDSHVNTKIQAVFIKLNVNKSIFLKYSPIKCILLYKIY